MKDNHMTPTEQRATWGLGTVFSLRMLGMFMVLPVLTTWGTALEGANETLIGVAIGIYGLAQAFFQIPFGLLSDKLGRKLMITLGLLLFLAGSVIAASTVNIWGVIIGRALQGAGAIAAAVMALLSDLTREQNRTKAMAFIGISFGITFAVAMVIGPIVTHHFGLHALFWLMAVLAGSAILITLLVVPDAKDHHLNRESGIVSGSIRAVLANPRLLKLDFGIMSLHILLMSTFVALPDQFVRAGFSADQHWKVYLTTMLIAFSGVIPFIIYAEKKRHMKQVFIGCVITLLGAEVVLWQAHQHFWWLVAGTQLFFFAFNLLEAILPSLVSKESPAGYKGTAMGVYSTSQFIGVAIGGSASGWLLGHYSAQSVFIAAALLALIWLFISFTMKEPPYLSSLRIVFQKQIDADRLTERLRSHPGVTTVFVVPEEKSAYVKIDSKKTSRPELEALVASL